MSERVKPVVGFLGPLGTYSHQAAFNYFKDKAEYQPEPTISRVFSSLSADVPFICLPLANSTHGSVIETLDLLRSERWSRDAFIMDETTIKIEHCLVVACNPDDGESASECVLDAITTVYSHEQALGQCSNWLDQNLPRAKRVKTESTALAAQRILGQLEKDVSKEGLGRSAAICSEVCVSTYPGLKLARKGIQDRGNNETRFIIASMRAPSDAPSTNFRSGLSSKSLIRIAAHSSTLGGAFSILVSKSHSDWLSLQRIDRRPKTSGPQWEDVYFVELLISKPQKTTLEELMDGLLTSLRPCVEVTILGIW